MKEEIQEFINDPLVIALKQYLMQEDILQITGKDRDEVFYNRFLEWFFDSYRNQDLGITPVRLFLKMLPKADYWSKVIGCTAKENANSENGRVDLLLNCELEDGSTRLVCIENKVYSDTQNNQLERYYNDYNDINVIFCILAPNPEILTEKHPAYQEITYQDLMDNVLIPIKKISENNLLNQIIHAMECPSKEKPCKKVRNPLALSATVAEQIETLMSKYGDFILKVLKTRNEKNSEEIQDLLKIMSNDKTITTKGYYLFFSDIEGDEIIGPFPSFNIDLVRALAVLYIKKNKIKNEEEFKESALAKMTMGDGDIEIYSLVQKSTSYYKTPLEIKDEEYQGINGKIYFYSQIRTPKQQNNFIKAIKNLGFKIIQNL